MSYGVLSARKNKALTFEVKPTLIGNFNLFYLFGKVFTFWKAFLIFIFLSDKFAPRLVKHFIELRFHNFQTFAGAVRQSFRVENFHLSARIGNSSRLIRLWINLSQRHNLWSTG